MKRLWRMMIFSHHEPSYSDSMIGCLGQQYLIMFFPDSIFFVEATEIRRSFYNPRHSVGLVAFNLRVHLPALRKRTNVCIGDLLPQQLQMIWDVIYK